MRRRSFLRQATACLGTVCLTLVGCKQTAQVLHPCQKDMVGSNCAGAEVYKPLIHEAVGKLLARHSHGVEPVGNPPSCVKRICFVGVENASAEELCDFKEQITEIIDTLLVESRIFQTVSRRFVEVGLRQLRLRPDELFLPANQRAFKAVLEQQGQPFDYLLFAKLTSGTTRNNSDMQRDYLLTLELVDLQTGQPDKESATLRKSYHKSHLHKALAY